MSRIALTDGGWSPDRAAVPGHRPHQLVPSAQVMHGAVVVRRAALQTIDTSFARGQDAVAGAQRRPASALVRVRPEEGGQTKRSPQRSAHALECEREQQAIS